MTTNNQQERGFATITTPDGRLRIWMPRPTAAGKIYASCNFPLAGHWDFVDALDTLSYVCVDGASTYDNDYSSLQMTCLRAPEGCLERLMEDLPELMEEWL